MTTLVGLWLLSSQVEPPSHPRPSAPASHDVDRDRDGQERISGRLISSSVGAPIDTSTAADSDWWAQVQRGLAEYEYHPKENGKGLQAPNRAHNLRTYFDSTGIRIQDRSGVGTPELVGLSLVGIGRGDALAPVSAGKVSHAGTRVEIRRDRILEWYENSAKGLEQGFTLEQQPPGEGPLVLELRLESARAALHGETVVLATDAGRKLRYGALTAQDAAGRTLVSRLAVPSPSRVQLVVNDIGATYPLVIDPLVTAIPDAFLESNQLGTSGIKPSGFGRSVAGAGDVNGDGFADVIVGAWGWDGGANEEGAAFVFLGSAAGIVGTDPATAFARIESNNAAARFGWSVSGAGDVNNDGFDDIVIGSYLYRSTVDFEGFGPGTVQGAAFVYLGSATGMLGAADPSLANARILSNEIDSFLGYSVSGAGDVNGDGFADIMVGGPRAGIPFPPNIPPYDRQGNGGVVLVFLGSANGITGTGFEDAHKELRPYLPGFPELADAITAGMGGSVSGAGDVNGDLFDDIILGSAGSAMLFLGSPVGIVGDDPTTAHAMIVSDGITPVGHSVSGAGDVNGDGFADIILGAPGAPIPTPGFSPDLLGAIQVFLGSSSGITATTAADAHATIEGVIRLQQLGWDVSAAGDVDGDGFDDVIAGALNYAGSLDFEGAAYVFRGGPDGIVGTSLRDDAYVRLESQQSGAAIFLVDIALSASGVGDINGDGFADVILGTGFFDAGEVNEGAAFVYHGGEVPLFPNQPPVAVAGADQVYLDIDNDFSATITIDGSASFDPDGAIASYEWREGEVLLGTSSVLTTALPASGDHNLVLVVTDDAGLRRGDPVTVRVEAPDTPRISFDDFSSGFAGGSGWAGSWTVAGDVSLSSVDNFPSPPQARMGAGATLSRSVNLPGSTGISVKFEGKASQFAALDQVLIQVSVDGAPFTTIHTIDSSQSNDTYVTYGTTLPAPPGLSTRITHSWFPATASNVVLRFASNATDGIFFVDNVSVSAWSVPPGTPPPSATQLPVAHAGVDITVDDDDTDGFESVILDGTQSTDADGFIASHQWFEETSGGTSLIGTGSTLGASFGHGAHQLRLVVTDNDGGSSADTMVVTVNEVFPGNQSPVANAGPDQTIVDVDGNTLEVLTFNGSASTDSDGTIVSYIWRKNGNTFGSGVTFSVNQPIGVHTVDLTVTDDQGATSTDTVVVTVVPNDPTPTIESFFATSSSITAGEFTNLVWTLTGTVTATIDNGIGAIGLTGSFLVNPTTTTTYTLTATGTGGTATATTTVTVNSAPPGPPTVDSFSATPTTITAGESVSLSWTTTGADSVSINGGTSLPADGNSSVSPTTTTTYTLTATGAGGTATDSVVVTVQAVPPTGSDFKTQVVKLTIPAGASSVVSSAFESVDPSRTVALISGVTQHAMGWTAERTQDPVEISAYVELIASGTTLSATRASSVNQSDTVWVLLIEYVGQAGGGNEFVVRDRRVHDWSAGQGTTTYGPIGSVVNGNQVVVFGSGSSNTNTASSAYDRADVRAWMDGGNTVQLARGDGAGAISSSQQVVEFVGSNWTIQTGDTAPSPDPGGTDVAINSVTDVSNAWVYFTWSANSANLDERGHRVWLTSPTSLRVQEDAAATGTKTIRWSVISNPNMQVQSGEANNVLTSTNTGTITGFVPVVDLARSFAWVTGMTDGGGNAHPRDMWQFELSNAATINLQRGRTGQELSHRYFVVELPSAAVSPGAPGAPSVDSFTASPAVITDVEFATLNWTTTDADSVSIDGGASLPANGSSSVTPTTTTTYTLTATGAGGTATSTVTVTVNPASPGPPTVDSFTASPAVITDVESATLSWTTTDADSVSIDGGVSLPANGNSSVSPTTTTTYTLTATGAGGTATSTVTVTVNPAPAGPPTVDSFTASPAVITDLESATLSWTTTDADSVSINGGASLPANGSSSVSPTTTTTYTLTATGAGGTATATVTVTVNPASPGPPTVNSFTASPAVITDVESATLSWTTTDADSVSIDGGASLPANGSSSVTPTTTTTYTLTATGAGGTASSTVTVTVNSGVPPQGSVSMTGPSSMDRGDRTSFTVTFTNTGSSTITGVDLSFAVSPNSLLKDVSPGGSVNVGDVAPGNSVSQTWNVRGDNEGSGTVTGSASSGGTSLDSVTQSLTVIK